jgi:hypothetical protein
VGICPSSRHSVTSGCVYPVGGWFLIGSYGPGAMRCKIASIRTSARLLSSNASSLGCGGGSRPSLRVQRVVRRGDAPAHLAYAWRHRSIWDTKQAPMEHWMKSRSQAAGERACFFASAYFEQQAPALSPTEHEQRLDTKAGETHRCRWCSYRRQPSGRHLPVFQYYLKWWGEVRSRNPRRHPAREQGTRRRHGAEAKDERIRVATLPSRQGPGCADE